MPDMTRGVSAPCRDAFDHVVDRSLALVAFLKAQGPAAVHNMDNLLLRESMDVIGVPSCLHNTCGPLPKVERVHRVIEQRSA